MPTRRRTGSRGWARRRAAAMLAAAARSPPLTLRYDRLGAAIARTPRARSQRPASGPGRRRCPPHAAARHGRRPRGPSRSSRPRHASALHGHQPRAPAPHGRPASGTAPHDRPTRARRATWCGTAVPRRRVAVVITIRCDGVPRADAQGHAVARGGAARGCVHRRVPRCAIRHRDVVARAGRRQGGQAKLVRLRQRNAQARQVQDLLM